MDFLQPDYEYRLQVKRNLLFDDVIWIYLDANFHESSL